MRDLMIDNSPTSETSSSAEDLSTNTTHTYTTPSYHSQLVNHKDNITIDIKRFKEGSLSEHLKCVPLSSDAEFALYSLNRHDTTFVTRVYAALRHFTGESDESYDAWKGSFSFKFLLDVNKAGQVSQYLYWVLHYRQFMRIEIYQCVPKTDPRSSEVSSEPEKVLFSSKDMTEFTISFFRTLLSDAAKAGYMPKPFVIKADSELCFSGFLNGKYFVNQHEEEESYEKDYNKIVDVIARC
jgi:hypothetical protein